jgi:hypothetical protein
MCVTDLCSESPMQKMEALKFSDITLCHLIKGIIYSAIQCTMSFLRRKSRMFSQKKFACVFEPLKHSSIYRDVIELPFCVCWRCTSIMAAATLSNEVRQNDTYSWLWGKTGNAGYIVCSWVLLVVMENTIWIGNSLLYSLKWMVQQF